MKLNNPEFKPGSLVSLRNRPWVVQPSEDRELLLLKPLGGSDEEITGIYLPVTESADRPVSYDFMKPTEEDLGDFTSAKLLYNAARISFRNAAGPFRCLGKLSFRPRSYQMVPMIMALRQEITRLLIADDVGVGKTIEALLIAKELYERKEIKRYAIVCLPHLCDQWQDELKNKFGIEAVIIRSGTASSLERQIRNNENIFRVFPFQIISIDYIKSGNRRQVFIDHCPELVIVDEAHTCTNPAGASNDQQLRYRLLHDISKKESQHLVLLTATPHSGKQAEFQSLLGLLKPSFERLDLLQCAEQDRKDLARHFIQRRRADVLKWLGEETSFPERLSNEKDYAIGAEYAEVFNDILDYAREIVSQHSGNNRKQRYSYWDALALLRGVMSSPAAGITMLKNKAEKKRTGVDQSDDYGTVEADDTAEENIIMDVDFSGDDNLPLSVLGKAEVLKETESRRLMGYARRLEKLKGIEHDLKAREAISQIKDFLKKGYNPIIFCRYIHTADYLGGICRQHLTGKQYGDLHIEVITGFHDDELRRVKIDSMNASAKRLLIATDCLSEGINLQDGFDAMLHYDLPWNPNRLEQREGRIDRFGQKSKVVEVSLLYGSNNPIDGVVLEVLLRKAREIRRSIGISVPFPENSASVMEAVTKAILLKPSISVRQVTRQLSLFESDEIEAEKKKVEKAFFDAEEREKKSRSIFAQNSIKAGEIESDIREVDDVMGDVKAIQSFVIDALRFMGVQVEEKKEGYRVFTTNIPPRLKQFLTDKNEILISFQSPTPTDYKYLGRNHPFTAHLSQYILNSALQRGPHRPARASVIRTNDVKQKTVLFQFRVRNVIAEQTGNAQLVAEEMWLWGYEGNVQQGKYINSEAAIDLLLGVKPSLNMEDGEKTYWLNEELAWVRDAITFRRLTDGIALERAQNLVDSHTRFRKLISGYKYKVVEPVLPMDVLGVYILLPVVS